MDRVRLSHTVIAALLAATFTASSTATDLSGEWKGRWKSCQTGHEGPLKATFCRVNRCQYEVTFRGRFFKLLPFRYQVKLRIVSDNGHTITLQGSEKLGKLLGVYCYSATANRCTFHCDYSAKDDHGYFHLQRH